MCVIIHARPKQTIEKKILEACYQRNSDGWGIMWADKGKVHTIKDMTNFDTFYNIWKDVPRHAERGIHFRIKTHGGKNQENCHPFKPREDVALMHNGMINSMPLIEPSMSDTYNFCEYEVAPLISGWTDFIKDEDFKKLLELHDVTNSSKLLFIDAAGNTLRINDRMWSIHEGVHFSNSFSIPYKAPDYSKHISYGHNSNVATNRSNVSSGSLNTTYDCNDANYDEYGWPVESGKNVLDYEEYRASIKGTITKETTLLGSPVVKSAERIVSDIFAGNKTAEEGEAYLASKEAEAAEEARLEQEDLNAALGGEEVNPFPLEEDSGETPEEDTEEQLDMELDLDTIMCMTFRELSEDMEDNPKPYALAFRELIDICASAGIFKITSGDTGIVLNAKAAS